MAITLELNEKFLKECRKFLSECLEISEDDLKYSKFLTIEVDSKKSRDKILSILRKIPADLKVEQNMKVCVHNCDELLVALFMIEAIGIDCKVEGTNKEP